MEWYYLAAAFACGFLVLQVGLPPLLGFLAAGFILNLLGFASTETLQVVADLGVTLLLFTIGLKLHVNQLVKPQVWATGSGHMLLSTLLITAALKLFGLLNFPLLANLDWHLALLLGFALSFSSTVFAVKVLENQGQLNSLYGATAIGILVMQDIFAVVYLAISTGRAPNVYAIPLLLGLVLLRPMLLQLLDRSRHGEILPLFGIFTALMIGYQAFEFAGIKGDLGALVIGMLIASHPKAGELAKSLLSIKDLLLIGFFLNIGLMAELNQQALYVALLLLLLLPLKVFLYFVLMAWSRLRARTAVMSAMTLANYSEFGLIVAALAAKQDLLTADWLAVLALALAMSFLLSSPLQDRANALYLRFEPWFRRFERVQRLPEEQPFDVGDSKILILGMGRIGTGAYDDLVSHGHDVLGVEIVQDRAQQHIQAGRHVILADATDRDFWQRVNHCPIQTVLLAMPMHEQNLLSLEQLKASGFVGQVSAIVSHVDQEAELRQHGIDSTFNLYAEAGMGFAEHVHAQLVKMP
ncbi:MAG: cation:proton antiporter family protein [Pseudomonadota bacterium]|nr:cation:proton antiporter family protein [Pseudomonadota bacterium]